MITAIIPARGGSKGIPNKNLRRINGQTLLSQAIRKCLRVCDEVIVSSDSDHIMSDAYCHGAIPDRRPAELSTDEASTVDVLRYVATRHRLDRIALVQCTAPMMTDQDVAACLIRTDVDLAVCCHPFHGYVLDGSGKCVNRQVIPVPRRQDVKPQWLISGSVWAFDASYLEQAWYSGSIGIVPSEHPQQLDIDTIEDLRRAEELITPETL